MWTLAAHPGSDSAYVLTVNCSKRRGELARGGPPDVWAPYDGLLCSSRASPSFWAPGSSNNKHTCITEHSPLRFLIKSCLGVGRSPRAKSVVTRARATPLSIARPSVGRTSGPTQSSLAGEPLLCQSHAPAWGKFPCVDNVFHGLHVTLMDSLHVTLTDGLPR